jgi:hypothetical protein
MLSLNVVENTLLVCQKRNSHQSNKTMKYSIEEMKKWIELDEMKSRIRKVFASDAKTNEISGDDIKAIYKIIFKDKK